MLASGSSGNAAVVASGRTRILIDAGLSCKELARRLGGYDLAIGDLDAVVLTHEHGDHVSGLAGLAGRWGRTIYLTGGTRRALRAIPEGARIVQIESGRPFQVGHIYVNPFEVSHDAAEPLGFTFEDETGKVGYVTDLGKVTPGVRNALRSCRLLAMEFNHDLGMLETGPYPAPLKSRIMSDVGHLSNGDSAELLRSSVHDELEWVFLAHLSRTNNDPVLARDCANGVLSRCSLEGINISVAAQSTPGPWVSLDKRRALW